MSLLIGQQDLDILWNGSEKGRKTRRGKLVLPDRLMPFPEETSVQVRLTERNGLEWEDKREQRKEKREKRKEKREKRKEKRETKKEKQKKRKERYER